MSTPRKLPRAGTWEVGLVPVPGIQIRDEVLVGMLLVVEQTGLIRMAAPITHHAEIAQAVKQAARAPVSGTEPARPRTLVCAPELRFALNGVAQSLGAKLKVAEVLPLVEEAIDGLQDFLAPGIPLVPEDPTPWRAIMADLLRERPWETLPDRVQFRFRRLESLQDAVAIVVGALGEQLGIMLYPTEEDYEHYLDQARSGQPEVEELCFWCANLDPVDDLPGAHVEVGRELGLVQEDLALSLYAVRGGAMQRLSFEEERSTLAAVQGVLGAWLTHRGYLATGDTTTRAPTVLGELEVRTTPDTMDLDLTDLPEPLILEVDHQLILTTVRLDGEELPGLTLKMAKGDARRLARILDERHEVDAISIEEVGDHVDVVAWDGDLEVGVLARSPPQAGLWDQWREHGRGALIVSGGGAKRRGLREQDVILLLHVDLYDSTVQDHPPFHPGILEGASWEGPAHEWPKASTVLLDFAEPLGVAEMPTRDAQQALVLAALVWSGVVLADHGGQPELLEQAMASVPIPEMARFMEMLVERKRSLYPQDHRIMQVENVTRSKGRIDVRVIWSEVG